MKIYIAGPYSKGDVAMNVRNAVEAADKLRALGHTPFIPHLSHFWHLMFPHEYQFWLDYDNEWLPLCDCILRLPGESSGSEKEIALARSLNIPAIYDIKDIARISK